MQSKFPPRVVLVSLVTVVAMALGGCAGRDESTVVLHGAYSTESREFAQKQTDFSIVLPTYLPPSLKDERIEFFGPTKEEASRAGLGGNFVQIRIGDNNGRITYVDITESDYYEFPDFMGFQKFAIGGLEVFVREADRYESLRIGRSGTTYGDGSVDAQGRKSGIIVTDAFWKRGPVLYLFTASSLGVIEALPVIRSMLE